MSEIEKLTELFTRFPGIGPRQAKRFVFFLLRQDTSYRSMLNDAINDAVSKIRQCSDCLQYSSIQPQNTRCKICSDKNRNESQLMLVEKDTDIEQMEKSEAYNGKYFVLGGVMSLTGRKNYLREKELAKYFNKNGDKFSEIILALSTTPDGEYTTEYLVTKIKKSSNLENVSITILGRGLSTGAELEYADANTLKQALKNRY